MASDTDLFHGVTKNVFVQWNRLERLRRAEFTDNFHSLSVGSASEREENSRIGRAQGNHEDLRALYGGDTSVALYRDAFTYTLEIVKNKFSSFSFSLSLCLSLSRRVSFSLASASQNYILYILYYLGMCSDK